MKLVKNFSIIAFLLALNLPITAGDRRTGERRKSIFESAYDYAREIIDSIDENNQTPDMKEEPLGNDPVDLKDLKLTPEQEEQAFKNLPQNTTPNKLSKKTTGQRPRSKYHQKIPTAEEFEKAAKDPEFLKELENKYKEIPVKENNTTKRPLQQHGTPPIKNNTPDQTGSLSHENQYQNIPQTTQKTLTLTNYTGVAIEVFLNNKIFGQKSITLKPRETETINIPDNAVGYAALPLWTISIGYSHAQSNRNNLSSLFVENEQITALKNTEHATLYIYTNDEGKFIIQPE